MHGSVDTLGKLYLLPMPRPVWNTVVNYVHNVGNLIWNIVLTMTNIFPGIMFLRLGRNFGRWSRSKSMTQISCTHALPNVSRLFIMPSYS